MGAFAGPLRVDVGYEVVRQGNLWQLAYVNVCPAPKYASACGEVVEYKGQRYRRYVNPPGWVLEWLQPSASAWRSAVVRIR